MRELYLSNNKKKNYDTFSYAYRCVLSRDHTDAGHAAISDLLNARVILRPPGFAHH